jgi:microcystin degradation protein MlrC
MSRLTTRRSILLMATQNPTSRAWNDPASPATEDEKTQAAVLVTLLAEHPMQLTLDELVLVLHGDMDCVDPEDAARRAVRDLVGAGLVRHLDQMVMPTRAALCFARLPIA